MVTQQERLQAQRSAQLSSRRISRRTPEQRIAIQQKSRRTGKSITQLEQEKETRQRIEKRASEVESQLSNVTNINQAKELISKLDSRVKNKVKTVDKLKNIQKAKLQEINEKIEATKKISKEREESFDKRIEGKGREARRDFRLEIRNPMMNAIREEIQTLEKFKKQITQGETGISIAEAQGIARKRAKETERFEKRKGRARSRNERIREKKKEILEETGFKDFDKLVRFDKYYRKKGIIPTFKGGEAVSFEDAPTITTQEIPAKVITFGEQKGGGFSSAQKFKESLFELSEEYEEKGYSKREADALASVNVGRQNVMKEQQRTDFLRFKADIPSGNKFQDITRSTGTFLREPSRQISQGIDFIGEKVGQDTKLNLNVAGFGRSISSIDLVTKEDKKIRLTDTLSNFGIKTTPGQFFERPTDFNVETSKVISTGLDIGSFALPVVGQARIAIETANIAGKGFEGTASGLEEGGISGVGGRFTTQVTERPLETGVDLLTLGISSSLLKKTASNLRKTSAISKGKIKTDFVADVSKLSDDVIGIRTASTTKIGGTKVRGAGANIFQLSTGKGQGRVVSLTGTNLRGRGGTFDIFAGSRKFGKSSSLFRNIGSSTDDALSISKKVTTGTGSTTGATISQRNIFNIKGGIKFPTGKFRSKINLVDDYVDDVAGANIGSVIKGTGRRGDFSNVKLFRGGEPSFSFSRQGLERIRVRNPNIRGIITSGSDDLARNPIFSSNIKKVTGFSDDLGKIGGVTRSKINLLSQDSKSLQNLNKAISGQISGQVSAAKVVSTQGTKGMTGIGLGLGSISQAKLKEKPRQDTFSITGQTITQRQDAGTKKSILSSQRGSATTDLTTLSNQIGTLDATTTSEADLTKTTSVSEGISSTTEISTVITTGFPQIDINYKIPPPLFFPKKFRPQTKGSLPTEPYNVYVKSRGKFKKVNKNPLQKSQALALGSWTTDNTLSAQFKIRKGKGNKTKPSAYNIPQDYFPLQAYKFRNFEVKKGRRKPLKNTFIEKRGQRLDTPGEINKIQAERFLSQQRKRAIARKKRGNKANRISATDKKLKKVFGL